jgi:hypothetical protein
VTGPRIIGLCGFARTGKDTVGAYLAERHGYERQAFADKLRLLAEDLDPWVSDEDFITHIRYSEALASHGYEKAKDEFPEIRRFLVALGKGVRDVLGPNTWVDAVLPDALPDDHAPLVITDVRYPNEAARILRFGGEVWYVTRRGFGPANDEEAESINGILQRHLFTVGFNNSGTVEDLLDNVEGYLQNR